MLRDDELELIGEHRCAKCGHLLGLHIPDYEYDEDICAVRDCRCVAESIGPITYKQWLREQQIKSGKAKLFSMISVACSDATLGA